MTTWLVVGGGSAGCVVAARLSERSGDEITLLEAGPDHGTVPAVGDDGPYLTDVARLRTDLVTRRPGTEPVPYVRGHGLAGSSLINGGVVTSPDTPAGHMLPLQDPWADGPVGAALLASDEVAERVRLVRSSGRRVTAADAYLRPVLHRPNLAVTTGVAVTRVVVESRRVVGVITDDGRAFEADRVVMCAGAIHTPAILLRSGVDTPGIGDGLQDHPAVTIALRLAPEAVDAGSPPIAVAANHASHQVLAMNHLAGAPDLGALIVALVDTRSRGSVRLPDPDGPPVVELHQLGDRREVDALTDAVSSATTMLGLPAWRDVVEAAYVDDLGTSLSSIASSREAIARWVRDHLDGYYHAASTCRDGVVCDSGVVRGYDGLYVADASALAALPRHDPYIHVISRAAELADCW